MWIGYNEQQSELNNIFLIMGKALRLCQNLEHNITHIVSIIKLEEGIKSGEIQELFDANWNSVILQMKRYFLKTNIQHIEKTGIFSDEVIDKLEKGRISRNRIIHDSIIMLSTSIHKGIIQENELDEYLKEITNVAIADNIVSGLDWLINEKELPCKSEHQYIEEIKNWIKHI